MPQASAPEATGDDEPVARPARRIGTGPLPSRRVAQEATVSAESRPAARPAHDDAPDGPDQLSVDDTITKMGETTMLRMAELSRLNKRRTGFLHHKEESNRDESPANSHAAGDGPQYGPSPAAFARP